MCFLIILGVFGLIGWGIFCALQYFDYDTQTRVFDERGRCKECKAIFQSMHNDRGYCPHCGCKTSLERVVGKRKWGGKLYAPWTWNRRAWKIRKEPQQ